MATKPVSANLDERTVKYIKGTFESIYQGVKLSIESFIILRRMAADEIKGLFTEEELSAIVDIMNGTYFDPAFAQKSALTAVFEDAEQFDGTLTKWGVNQTVIINKLKNITEIQCFFVMFEAWNFWYNPTAGGNPDLDNFLKKWTSEK